MTERDPHMDQQTEEAIRERLGKLSGLPVDTTRLERMLREEIPKPAVRVRRWLKPMLAAAAGLLITASASLVLLPGGEVHAAPSQLIAFHEDIVAGRVPGVTLVSTIDEAKRALAAHGADLPTLPRPQVDELHACCMKPLDNKNVACVLMKHQGVPITMSVAKASDVKLPKSTPVHRNGVAYHVEHVQGYCMVMTERKGTWVCLVGKLPANDLIMVAAQLEF